MPLSISRGYQKPIKIEHHRDFWPRHKRVQRWDASKCFKYDLQLAGPTSWCLIVFGCRWKTFQRENILNSWVFFCLNFITWLEWPWSVSFWWWFVWTLLTTIYFSEKKHNINYFAHAKLQHLATLREPLNVSSKSIPFWSHW